MKQTILVSPLTPDEYINLLPNGSHKFEHRIIVKRDYNDFTRVLTAVPVINTESKQLVAFIDIIWEKDYYNRKIE